MRALVFKKKGELEWQELPDPLITGPGQAILRPLATARCDLDLPIVRGQTLFRPAFPIGHEFIGEVVAASDDLNLRPGQIAAAAFQISCGTCPACASRHTRSCAAVPFASNYGLGPSGRQFGGSLAEKVFVPYAKSMLQLLPDNVDVIGLASLSDNIAEAWKLAGRHIRGTERVLVTGGLAASIGLYTTMLALGMGADVTYADTDPNRLAKASSLGAKTIAIDAWPKTLGEFDLVCEAAGSPEAWMTALRSTAPEAVVTSASIFFRNDVPIPYIELYNKNVRLEIGRVDSRESMPEILSRLGPAFDPGKIVTDVVSLSDAREAWLSESTKLVVDMRKPK